MLRPKERSLTGRRDLYSKWFLDGANRLVESLTGQPVEDELIYPIVYLSRHHLELELKGKILYCPNWLSVMNAGEVKEFVAQKRRLKGGVCT